MKNDCIFRLSVQLIVDVNFSFTHFNSSMRKNVQPCTCCNIFMTLTLQHIMRYSMIPFLLLGALVSLFPGLINANSLPHEIPSLIRQE